MAIRIVPLPETYFAPLFALDDEALEAAIEALFARPDAANLRVHFAKPGC